MKATSFCVSKTTATTIKTGRKHNQFVIQFSTQHRIVYMEIYVLIRTSVKKTYILILVSLYHETIKCYAMDGNYI